ncbi:MAG: outer membrane protein assembly factor BamE [Alphaproteobacteria bacterium]|nr:outer membrane protein assembly factor BamE [Alphaproteobacteria bacterium]
MIYRHFILPLFSIIMLTACASVTHSGVSIYDDEFSSIEAGSSKDEVVTAIGSPSIYGYEEEGKWYYVHTIWHRRLFFPYRLHQRTLVTIEFDDEELVATKQTEDITEQKLIKPDSRITPTLGVKTGVIGEIFGNIGGVH